MVYLARDTFTGREVALKTIEPEVFRDPEFGSVYRTQFQNEASLAGKLRHPYIVAILDAVVAEDSGHIAMEYVKGGDLSKHVKPANLMIAEGTDVKISDFGAAYLRKTHAVQTAAMGSPYYMSPEQVTGREVGFHSDMYSLGVVLYELLTGKKPYTADTLEALGQKIQTQEPVPPSKAKPGLPKSLDAIIAKAMAKKPENRFPAWADFALALSNAVQEVIKPGAI